MYLRKEGPLAVSRGDRSLGFHDVLLPAQDGPSVKLDGDYISGWGRGGRRSRGSQQSRGFWVSHGSLTGRGVSRDSWWVAVS